MSEETKKAPAIRFQGFTDDWEQRKLGELIENQTILLQSDGNHGELYPKSNEFSETGIPYLSASNIDLNTSSVDFSSSKYLPINKAKIFKKGIAKDGDILLAHNATVGPTVMLSTHYPFVVLSTTLTLFRINQSKMNPKFFLYMLRSAQFQHALKKMMKQTTRNQVPILTQRNIDVSYPNNIDEQTKLGIFFKQLDDTIALHQQKQRQIRSLKQGFIKNLFPNNKNSAPRIRFAIFNDDWNQRNASEIFTSVSDKNYPELPVLSASQEKGMVLRESNGIDIKYDQKSTGTYKRVLPGQFVMHLRSFQGGFAYSTIEGITSPAYTILAFRNKEDHYPLFWKSIFSSKNFIKRLEAITYGIRDGRSISYADFSTLRFWIPSYEEQKQIGDFIESIDATIAFYQRQIDMMQSLKKELLNKMFI